MKLFLVYGICMDSDVFLRVFEGSTQSSGQASFLHSGNSNPILFMFTLGLVAAALAFALPVYRAVLRSLASVPWLVAIYFWSSISILWSTEPTATFRYSVYLWAYLLCALIASLYLTSDEIIRIIGDTVAVLSLLSVYAQFYYPVAQKAPGWTGLYGEKNHLGIGMTIGIVALMMPRERWTLLRVAKVGSCTALLVLSQSGTAMLCTIAAVLTIVSMRSRARVRRVLGVSIAGFSLLGLVLVPNFVDRVLAVGGKNSTLTGRDVIWRFSFQQWLQKPLLGWGYTAFWNSQEALIQQSLGWNPQYSHNGFLEIALSLGIVGIIIIVGILVRACFDVIRSYHVIGEEISTWLIVSLLVLFLHDLTEVDFLIPAPLWFVFTIVYFSALSTRRLVLQERARNMAPAFSVEEAIA